MQEIHALRLLGQHLNIVALHAVVEDKDKVYLIMQLCRGGELFGHILSQGSLSERQARGYFNSMLTAVDACHTQGTPVTLVAAFGPLVVRN
jgi:serine/threonine protein kinase